MEKILHERLREFAKSHIYADNFKSDDYSLLMYPEEAEALANEIERYYIPRPRDNKGIPFVEGDIVYSVDPDTEYCAEVVKVNQTGLYICWENYRYDLVYACDMQHEKPKPKILDADGIEIKVGDKLFNVNFGDQMPEVVSVHKAGDKNLYCNRVLNKDSVCYKNGWDYAKTLTHKEPDSLEKLRDDMNAASQLCVAPPIKPGTLQKFADRLSALIERGV